MELYCSTIVNRQAGYPYPMKTIYTNAASVEEAVFKFYRYMTCQWVGYPWQEPDELVAGVFHLIEDGITIDLLGMGVKIEVLDSCRRQQE